MLTIRPEADSDGAAVRNVNQEAFQAESEADLVERLHRDSDVAVSLVALDGPKVVGHVLFSVLSVVGARVGRRLAALGPLAVLPDYQRQGVGGALIEHGLEACRRTGIAGVFVLGDPGYYGRFGFSAEVAKSVGSPFPGDTFMAISLRPGALEGMEGSLHYPPAFGLDAA